MQTVFSQQISYYAFVWHRGTLNGEQLLHYEKISFAPSPIFWLLSGPVKVSFWYLRSYPFIILEQIVIKVTKLLLYRLLWVFARFKSVHMRKTVFVCVRQSSTKEWMTFESQELEQWVSQTLEYLGQLFKNKIDVVWDWSGVEGLMERSEPPSSGLSRCYKRERKADFLFTFLSLLENIEAWKAHRCSLCVRMCVCVSAVEALCVWLSMHDDHIANINPYGDNL